MNIYDFGTLKQRTLSGKGKALVEFFKKIYQNEYQDKPITALPYSYKKLYYINGDRAKFEAHYFDRRKRLALLQVLAIADEAYLEELEDILFAIAEEGTWVLPAHNLTQDNTFDYAMIDLFSSETALYLAETVYIFKDRLSNDIIERIRNAVDEKIIKNYESQIYGFESWTINWAPVCACGVGVSYLLLFPEKFDGVKDRLFATFQVYANGYDEQGYCEEGMGYWQYGFGMFCQFFNTYVAIKKERPAFLDSQKLINVLKFAEYARLDDGVYLPFADGGSKRFTPSISMFLLIKNLFKDEFQLPKMCFLNDENKTLDLSKALWTKTLYCADLFMAESDKEDKKCTSVYYKDAQVFIYKTGCYSFTAKGGTNGDGHNHNDVGAFQIVKNSKRLISDYGAGKYTKDYFWNEKVRYGDEVFVCGSQSHSVPIIDGITQAYGKEYGAQVISQDENSFVIDIANAYKTDCEKLLVKYVAEEENVNVEYAVNGIKEKVVFRFVSDFEPKIDGDRVRIDEMQISSSATVVPKITKVLFEGRENFDVLYTIDYEVDGNSAVDVKFNFTFKE